MGPLLAPVQVRGGDRWQAGSRIVERAPDEDQNKGVTSMRRVSVVVRWCAGALAVLMLFGLSGCAEQKPAAQLIDRLAEYHSLFDFARWT